MRREPAPGFGRAPRSPRRPRPDLPGPADPLHRSGRRASSSRCVAPEQCRREGDVQRLKSGRTEGSTAAPVDHPSPGCQRPLRPMSGGAQTSGGEPDIVTPMTAIRRTKATSRAHARSSIYKAHTITTQWNELALIPGQHARRFDASFTVTPSGERAAASWQQFPATIFDTARNAAAYALTLAKRSIDRLPLRILGVDSG